MINTKALKGVSFLMKILVAGMVTVTFSTKGYGQTTSHELAEKVFASFQTRDISKLDTLIPTPAQLIAISKDLGRQSDTISFKKKLDEVYLRHLEEFKAKCLDFINDTTLYAVDWEHAVFEKSLAKKEEMKLMLDSVQVFRKLNVSSLEIFFKDKKYRFIILFKDVYEYHGVWKIGDNISFSRESLEGGAQKKI